MPRGRPRKSSSDFALKVFVASFFILLLTYSIWSPIVVTTVNNFLPGFRLGIDVPPAMFYMGEATGSYLPKAYNPTTTSKTLPIPDFMLTPDKTGSSTITQTIGGTTYVATYNKQTNAFDVSTTKSTSSSSTSSSIKASSDGGSTTVKQTVKTPDFALVAQSTSNTQISIPSAVADLLSKGANFVIYGSATLEFLDDKGNVVCIQTNTFLQDIALNPVTVLYGSSVISKVRLKVSGTIYSKFGGPYSTVMKFTAENAAGGTVYSFGSTVVSFAGSFLGLSTESKSFSFTGEANIGDLGAILFSYMGGIPYGTNVLYSSDAYVFMDLDFQNAAAILRARVCLVGFPPMSAYEDVHTPLSVTFNGVVEAEVKISPEYTASGKPTYTILRVLPNQDNTVYIIKVKAYYAGTYSVSVTPDPAYSLSVQISPQTFTLKAGEEQVIKISVGAVQKKDLNTYERNTYESYVFKITGGMLQDINDISVDYGSADVVAYESNFGGGFLHLQSVPDEKDARLIYIKVRNSIGSNITVKATLQTTETDSTGTKAVKRQVIYTLTVSEDDVGKTKTVSIDVAKDGVVVSSSYILYALKDYKVRIHLVDKDGKPVTGLMGVLTFDGDLASTGGQYLKAMDTAKLVGNESIAELSIRMPQNPSYSVTLGVYAEVGGIRNYYWKTSMKVSEWKYDIYVTVDRTSDSKIQTVKTHVKLLSNQYLYNAQTGVIIAKGPFEGDLNLVPGTWMVVTYNAPENAPIDTSQIYVAKTTISANSTSQTIDSTSLNFVQNENKSNVVKITQGANQTLIIQKVLQSTTTQTSDASSFDSLTGSESKSSDKPLEGAIVISYDVLKSVAVVLVVALAITLAARNLIKKDKRGRKKQ